MRGLQAIEKMEKHVLPSAQAAQALRVIAPWVEMQILSSTASTYASIWHQGRQAAEQACEFFKI